MTFTASTLRHPCIILLIACLWLGGCASKYGPQTTVVNYYPQCYLPIENLRQAEKEFASTVATTVVVSTLVGAITGLLISGDAKGALIGAGVGAASGLGMGYVRAKQNEHANANRRMASYMQDLEGDIRNLDEATASARMSIQCYNKQFQVALTDYKAKTITRIELDARYREITEGTNEAENILGVMIKETGTREEQYTAAINFEQEREDKESGKITQTSAEGTAPKKAEPKKTVAKKAEPKKAVAKKAAAPSKKVTTVAEKQDVEPAKPIEPNLEGMKTQTQNYQNSRQALAEEKEIAANYQASWAADLAALES